MRRAVMTGAAGFVLAVAASLGVARADQSPQDSATTSLPTSPPSVAGPSRATRTVPLSLLEAVRTTLRIHPAIQSAGAELAARKAEIDVARGPFDPVVTSDLSYTHDEVPVLPGERLFEGENAVLTDTTAFDVGASVTTIWGTRISPSVELSRVQTRSGSTPIPGVVSPAQRARVGVSVVQPLLRGAGRVGATSAVEAARLARDSAAFSLEGSAQQQVYLTTAAYFQLEAAAEDLTLLRATEVAAKQVVEDTKALVAEQHRARSDLPGLEGNLANRTRAVLEAENNRLQALYALALAMGLGAGEIPNFQPTDGFPSPQAPALDPATILQQADHYRSDLHAARAMVAAAAARLRGAEWNARPKLDLSASVGYAGASDRDGLDAFLAAAGQSVSGVNGAVGLTLELPINNTALEADRDLKRAQHEQTAIAVRDLERQLPVHVLSALDDLRLSKEALESSVESVKQFDRAVSDQRDKLREGVGTTIDLVLTQELFIAAEQGRTANQLRCALALLRVLLQTGALPATENSAVGAIARLLSP